MRRVILFLIVFSLFLSAGTFLSATSFETIFSSQSTLPESKENLRTADTTANQQRIASDPALTRGMVRKGTVSASSLNVRLEPWGRIIGSLKEDERVTITGKKGDWYRILWNGKKGYIHSDYVDLVSESGNSSPASGQDAGFNDPFTMAVVSDLHCSDENLKMCLTAFQSINAMKNVRLTAILGDICERIGSPKEYKKAEKLLSFLTMPFLAVLGNHDFRSADELSEDDKKVKASKSLKLLKQKRFMNKYKQKKLRFAKKKGGHLLVFLPVDSVESKSIVALSDKTLDYLKDKLADNPSVPTIIFCHAPLKGSCIKKGRLKPIHAYAQPAKKIKDILKNNPQVFLWVAGHRHIKPGSVDYKAPHNLVDGVTVIHVPNVTDSEAWVLTLELDPEKALVRTWDANGDKYLLEHDRIFKHPKK